MNTGNYDLKSELQAQAQLQPVKDTGVKLTKDMSIPDIERGMTPSALNESPQLKQCTRMTFSSALLPAAQLGLEPNTPVGQAYLIPYKHKGTLECQFQIGDKGLIDLACRNGQMHTIQAQAVYE